MPSTRSRQAKRAKGFEIRWMQVGDAREGLIYGVDNYSDMAEALAAVGLGQPVRR